MSADNPGTLARDFITLTDAWRRAYPGAHIGVLAIRGATNSAQSEELDTKKRELEDELRTRHGGKDRALLRTDPILRVYAEYYRRFGKTYHVLLQLESILFKGKTIPSGAALVEAMFMAEVGSGLLTAGHDLDLIEGTLRLDVATGRELYTLLRDKPQAAQAGDMMISDQIGIISSIVYGPDARTKIRESTHRVIFTVYAPDGSALDAVQQHLGSILEYARLSSPTTAVEFLEVLPGG